MFNFLFTLLIFIGSIWIFYQGNYAIAVIFLVWALSRYFGVGYERLSKGDVGAFKNAEGDANTNYALDFNLFIDKILDHPKSKALYERLKKNKIVNTSYDKWKKSLINNYDKCYHKEKKKMHAIEKVVFRVKGNLLLKGREIEYSDALYHYLFIPYQDKNTKMDKEEIAYGNIRIGISIRLILVNGVIKLQIGEFDQDTSPKIISDKEWWEIYRNFETISSIPIMYFGDELAIPEGFMNFTVNGTDSYYLGEDKSSKIDRMKDWKELWKDAHKYFWLCSNAENNDADYKKYEAITNEFDKKRKKWLKREQMNDPLEPEEYPSSYSDCYNYLFNDYWEISIFNQKAFNEGRKRFIYGDYKKHEPS